MGLGHVRLGKFSFCHHSYGRFFPYLLQAVLDHWHRCKSKYCYVGLRKLYCEFACGPYGTSFGSNCGSWFFEEKIPDFLCLSGSADDSRIVHGRKRRLDDGSFRLCNGSNRFFRSKYFLRLSAAKCCRRIKN